MCPEGVSMRSPALNAEAQSPALQENRARFVNSQPMGSRRVLPGRKCGMGGSRAKRPFLGLLPLASWSRLQRVWCTATVRGRQMQMGLVVSYAH